MVQQPGRGSMSIQSKSESGMRDSRTRFAMDAAFTVLVGVLPLLGATAEAPAASGTPIPSVEASFFDSSGRAGFVVSERAAGDSGL